MKLIVELSAVLKFSVWLFAFEDYSDYKLFMVEAEQQEAYPSSQVQNFKSFTTDAFSSLFGPDGLT